MSRARVTGLISLMIEKFFRIENASYFIRIVSLRFMKKEKKILGLFTIIVYILIS